VNATQLKEPSNPASVEQLEAGKAHSAAAARVLPKLPELNLRDFLRKVWRRKFVLIGAVVVVMLATVVIVRQLTPLYSSTAQVMIDPRLNQVVDIQAVISGLPPDLETIESEIEILRSRRLAEKVIQKLRLYERPEFNETLVRKPEWYKYFRLETYLPERFVEMLFPPEASGQLTEEGKLNRIRVEVVDKFLERLSLTRSGRSRVIAIRFLSEDPDIAARVANALADVYIVEQLEAKFEATKRATEWLNERVGTLRSAVTDSERAVETFRKNSGLLRGKGMTLATQQISELNSQIIVARTKRAEAQARLSQVSNLLRSKRDVDSAAEVLSSRLIQRLREEESLTLRKAAELSQEFGARHPRMINIRAELEDLRAKIRSEVDKIVQNLRNEVNVAQVRERTLVENLQRLEQRMGQLNTSEVQLRALEREAAANRALYETFLSRFKETNQQQDIQQADARIISRADISVDASFPPEKLVYLAALIGSIGLGIVLIFFVEQLDQGFRSMSQVEHATGIPALGLIPMIGGVRQLTTEPYKYIIERPVSAFGEAVRSLYTSILLSNVDAPPKTVLITSSLPNEGKTSLSISLARQVASQSQKKVVLIDADLRRPQVHKNLGFPLSPGLVEYLSGNAQTEEILHRDEASGAIVICAGGTPHNPTDVLASDQMRRLIAQLSETNDLVIIDSPPVLAVSDPKVLSRLADKTVYVIRWAETRRETVMTGLKQIIDVGSDVAGVVLSMVNVRRHSQYGYGDSGSYYGAARKYYTR
tara:strand:+ start:354 stop:2648 length:2295 start_codon:yes stop_codon:yes gene_type:complete